MWSKLGTLKTNIISSLKLFSDKIHYLVIYLVLLAISLYFPLCFIFLLAYLIFIYKFKLVSKKLIIIGLVITIYFIIMFFFYNQTSSNINGTILVSKVEDNYFTFYYKGYKYMSYTSLDIKPGDILVINGNINDYLKESYSGDFNTITFLRGKNIRGIYDIKVIEEKGFIITFNRIREEILAYYQDKINPEYYPLFSCLVLGQNELENISNYQKLNILHVLALSGFHLLIIYNFVFRLVFYLTKRYVLSENISLIFLIFYTLLCGFTISLVRALLSLVLTKFNNRWNMNLTKLDVYSYSFIILLVNPLTIYNIGFIFSQITSFILMYLKEFIDKKPKFIKELLEGLIFMIISFPFMTNFLNEISLISLFSFILVKIISYIFIPLMFSFLLIPQLSNYLIFLVMGFNINLDVLANILTVRFPYLNSAFKIIYYVLVILIFSDISRVGKPKLIKVVSFISMFIIYIFSGYLTNDEVVFVDCGQGDFTFIKSDNKCFIIDCYQGYDYLSKRGIYSLEAIFVSHSDSDHLGDIIEIIENIKVNNIYYSIYDTVTKEYLKDYDIKQTPLTFNDTIKIGSTYIRVLSGNNKYDNVNDNSLILELNDKYYSYLFTGDISKEVEIDILDYLNKVNILKVAHHGSNTSTSTELIAKIRPDIAIISCGYKNYYGFPNKETITTLSSYSDIYISYQVGNIYISNKGLITYHDLWYNRIRF